MLSKKILIPLAVVFLSVPTAFPDSGNRPASDQKMDRARMINLTEEQKTQLRELRKTQKEGLRDNLLALRAAGVRLRIAFQSSDSEEEIRIRAAALSALKVQIDAARLDHQIAVWRILTPNQRLLMPQQGRLSVMTSGYQRDKDKDHQRFRDRKKGESWDKKHNINWKKSSAYKWRKNQQNSDSKKEY